MYIVVLVPRRQNCKTPFAAVSCNVIFAWFKHPL
jgi:hypothetical protein